MPLKKYFSDELMAAKSEYDANLIDEYRRIIRAARHFIEYSQDVHGPDPAGLGLETLNAIDKVM